MRFLISQSLGIAILVISLSSCNQDKPRILIIGDSIVSILQRITEAKLIFVTTTYVPENEAGRFKNDALRYNDAAKKIMKKHSVRVNDIYEASIPIHQELGKGSDDVHYSNQGYEKLGDLVTKFLEAEME